MKLNKFKSVNSCLLFFSLATSLVSCTTTKPAAVPSEPPTVAATPVGKAGSTAHASYKVEQREGVTLVEFGSKDVAGKDLLTMTVAPEAGSNIVSITYRGTEVLEQPISTKDISKQDAGIEFLYPTPNRVANSMLIYKDLKLNFTPNLGSHFIHGLAREAAWAWDEPKFDGNKVVYRTWLESNEGTSFYKQFPIKNRIEMVIVIDGENVNFKFNVANQDQRSLPFGVGIHPYFKLHGARVGSSVMMKVVSEMNAPDLIPNGKATPLKKTKYANLPKGMSVQDVMGADTVFWPKSSDNVAQVKEPGFKFDISSSKDFGHTVLWAPPTRELFAIENQTASTDAHNLANRGFKKESGLLELAPGKEWSGWVDYRFSKNK